MKLSGGQQDRLLKPWHRFNMESRRGKLRSRWSDIENIVAINKERIQHKILQWGSQAGDRLTFAI